MLSLRFCMFRSETFPPPLTSVQPGDLYCVFHKCIPQIYIHIYICYSELEVLPAWTKATRRLKSTSRATLQMLLLLWTMAAASDECLQKLLKQSLLTNSWVCEGSRRRVRGSTEGRKVRGKQAGERGMVGGTRCAQDFLDSVDLVNTSSRGPTHSTTPVT